MPEPLTAPGMPLPERAQRTARRQTAAILIGLVAMPLVLIDQLSKFYVRTHMALYQSVPVIPHWFDITYTENPGAAFSIFATLPASIREALLFALSAGAIVVLVALILYSERVTPTSLAFALILAGATGNLIDRAVRGRVIDFIRLHYYDLSYPVFNIADSVITAGVLLVIVAGLFSRKAPH